MRNTSYTALGEREEGPRGRGEGGREGRDGGRVKDEGGVSEEVKEWLQCKIWPARPFCPIVTHTQEEVTRNQQRLCSMQHEYIQTCRPTHRSTLFGPFT